MSRYIYKGLPYTCRTPEEEIGELKHRLCRAEHDLFFLWGFIMTKDEYEEATEFLVEREENEAPFGTFM